jgi:hypothetical protein
MHAKEEEFSPHCSALQENLMSNPGKFPEAQPHPESSHRTPREIAEDEAGAIGDGRKAQPKNLRVDQGPVRKISEPSEKNSDEKEP